jgi:hypothetical protein
VCRGVSFEEFLAFVRQRDYCGHRWEYRDGALSVVEAFVGPVDNCVSELQRLMILFSASQRLRTDRDPQFSWCDDDLKPLGHYRHHQTAPSAVFKFVDADSAWRPWGGAVPAPKPSIVLMVSADVPGHNWLSVYCGSSA